MLICVYMYIYIYIRPDPPRPLKNNYINNFGGLSGVPGPRRHAQYHCGKFLWETPYSPGYDHF